MDKNKFRVGARIWKTVLAVFICYIIDIFRVGGNIFYAMIAAVACMEIDIVNSFKKSIDRMIATLNGGFWGIVFITIGVVFNLEQQSIWRGIVISLLIIGNIKTACLLGKKQVSYLSCVVYLSIVVIHGFDHNPYLFALNRILDTLIGIVVSLVVNKLLGGNYENKQ